MTGIPGNPTKPGGPAPSDFPMDWPPLAKEALANPEASGQFANRAELAV